MTSHQKPIKDLTFEEAEKRRQRQRDWRNANLDKIKIYKERWHSAEMLSGWRRRVFLEYGITPEQYEALFVKQNGMCFICRNFETRVNKLGEVKRLSIDHNHKTGKIRSLLCSRCNVVIGQAEESIELLEKYITYIKNDGDYATPPV